MNYAVQPCDKVAVQEAIDLWDVELGRMRDEDGTWVTVATVREFDMDMQTGIGATLAGELRPEFADEYLGQMCDCDDQYDEDFDDLPF